MGALAKTPLTVTVGSLRTDTFEQLLQANSGVLELENCVVTQTGAVVKRNGNVALTNQTQVGTLSNTLQLGTYRGRLLSVSKANNLFNSGLIVAANRWSQEFNYAFGSPTVSTIPYKSGSPSGVGNSFGSPDMAESSGYLALSYGEFGPTSGIPPAAYIVDKSTGISTNVSNPDAIVASVRVMSLNGKFIYFWLGRTDALVHATRVTIASIPTGGAQVSSASDATTSRHATSPWFDIAANGSDKITVCYLRSDNTVWVTEYTVSTATFSVPAQMKDAAVANIAASQCLGFTTDIAGIGRVLLVADSGTGVKGHQITNNTVTVVTSTVIDAGATANVRNVTGYTTSAGNYNTQYEVTGTPAWQTQVKIATMSGGVVTLGSPFFGRGLRSRPFSAPDGSVCVFMDYESATQGFYTLECLSSSRTLPKVRFSTWKGNGRTEAVSHLTTPSVSGSSITCPFVERVRLESSGGAAVYFEANIAIKSFVSDDVNVSNVLETDGYGWIPGGVLVSFDGRNYTNHGWHQYPEAPTVAFSNTGPGGLVAGQTYSWILVYRRNDANGNVVRSIPSSAVTAAVTVGNNTATITAQIAQYAPLGGSSIEVYQTIAGGTTYYLSTTAAMSIGASTQNIVVTANDAALLSGEVMYVQPGSMPATLSSGPPPPTCFVESWDRRIWTIDSEDRTLLRFTNQFSDGIPPFFNDVLTTRISDEFGDCTALAPLDSKFIVFKERAIYMLTGIGPDATGQGSYELPQLIATGDGVASTQVRSVISTSEGVYFISAKGLCRLTRGLAVEYIGQPVQAYTSSFTCTGVVLMPDVTQLRWYSVGGTTLVYDYVHQVWGIHTGQPTSSVVLYNGLPVMADATGANLYQETPGAYLERGAQFAQKVTFPWLSLAGLRGYQRIYRIQGIGSCDNFTTQLTVTFTYDFDVTTAHAQVTTPPSAKWDWEARPNRQTCTAMKVTIAGAAVAGDGFTMAGFTLIYGAKTGLRPVDKTHRAI